ncbi:MAG: hypothetical protein DIZ78_09410 [endosymbiont of Escarpia spicata]|uniref:Uncharacterized protein n=1 Tax=endosymbiont of Escarpia spicata TaxID=2200908 RepID=A0A370DPZ7_9GAMM|nr:MAG: hypothetical protein DIZ78_09410 [endosymbiont of Escarpia spicata]
MAEEKQLNPWVLILLAALTGSTGSLSTQWIKPSRPDPYTGTQGAEERKARKSGDSECAEDIKQLSGVINSVSNRLFIVEYKVQAQRTARE